MSAFLDAPAPRWFTIGAHRPFLDDLAGGVWRALSPLGPEALADATILVPTRRAARLLASAFLRAAGGRALLPPQIRALGDLEAGEAPFEPGDIAADLPAAVPEMQRRFELAGLAARNAHLLGRELDAGGALEMADAAGALFEALALEEQPWPDSAEAIVPEEFAAHWRTTASFLDAMAAGWRDRLAELGAVDPAVRRIALLRRLAADWTQAPPQQVVLAAGSTGSAPAAADLLAVVARAPRGAVVLPGLDLNLAEAAWAEIDEPHPQSALKRLIERAGLGRADVVAWDQRAEAETKGRWRRRLVNEALRPAEATGDWLKVVRDLRDQAAPDAGAGGGLSAGLDGLSLIRARSEEEAACAVALLLRQALATPGRTAALVTPDARLARRVQARLGRWRVIADSSVGEDLAGAPAAVLATLVAGWTAGPFKAAQLLAIAKHPLVKAGFDGEALAESRERLETNGLRGTAPAGWDALQARAPSPFAGALEAALALAAEPFSAGDAPAADAARGLALALEALAGDDAVWRGQAGQALGETLAALIESGGALPPISAQGFADLLAALLARIPLRSGGATHPRLQILGVLEARLVRCDLTILAGLEEGVWPASAGVDPFLSRPMRAALGLPPPERRVGLSAHDFAQAACAPQVVLVHCRRRADAPTVASRWLWRLQALAKGAGLGDDLPGRPDILALARALDAPLADPAPPLAPARRPTPKPPVAARPRALSVTRIEVLERDPYAIYAQRVLHLDPLERPDQPIDARHRGTAVHAAFEAFARTWPEALPDDAEAEFAALLLDKLADAGMRGEALLRERVLAPRVAAWAIEFEKRQREGARVCVELRGEMWLTAPAGPFRLSARADRIEVRGGEADIVDFKTGAPPSAKQVEAGYAPQLTLTGAILAAGGFPGLPQLAPRQLVYARVGGKSGGEVKRCDKDNAPALSEAALARLGRLVESYDDPETAYPSWRAPHLRKFAGDYDTLARVWEWMVLGEEDEA